MDEEYNITGIIDWEFASAEAKELAFSSPCMMWPVAKFYDGDNALAEDEVRCGLPTSLSGVGAAISLGWCAGDEDGSAIFSFLGVGCRGK